MVASVVDTSTLPVTGWTLVVSVCGCMVTGPTVVVWILGRDVLPVVERVLSLSFVVTSGIVVVIVGIRLVALSVVVVDFVVVVAERVGPVTDVATLVVALGLGGAVLVVMDVASPVVTGDVTDLVVEVTLCVTGMGVEEVSG